MHGYYSKVGLYVKESHQTGFITTHRFNFLESTWLSTDAGRNQLFAHLASEHGLQRQERKAAEEPHWRRQGVFLISLFVKKNNQFWIYKMVSFIDLMIFDIDIYI